MKPLLSLLIAIAFSMAAIAAPPTGTENKPVPEEKQVPEKVKKAEPAKQKTDKNFKETMRDLLLGFEK